jgi:hypothetical protein
MLTKVNGMLHAVTCHIHVWFIFWYMKIIADATILLYLVHGEIWNAMNGYNIVNPETNYIVKKWMVAVHCLESHF